MQKFIKNQSPCRLFVAAISSAVLFGIIFSILPVFLSIIFIPLTLVLLITAICRRLPNAKWKSATSLFSTILFVIIIVLCALPMPYHDDVKIGPAVYRNTGLRELCSQLREDLDIRCMVSTELVHEILVDEFEIPEPMTRRAVMEKLAKETGMQFRFGGYCGNDMSIMFKGYPMVSWLEPAEAIDSGFKSSISFQQRHRKPVAPRPIRARSDKPLPH